MRIMYEFLATPYGECLAACTANGICHLSFSDFFSGCDHKALVAELARARPGVDLVEDSPWLREHGPRLFDPDELSTGSSAMRLDLDGTPFQLQVWCALIDIPAGTTLSYRELAGRIGRPRAVRAVAGAVARNHIAWLVPCHRIVRSDGGLGGYRWGAERKAAMLARERPAPHGRQGVPAGTSVSL